MRWPLVVVTSGHGVLCIWDRRFSQKGISVHVEFSG
jgi:hypothetical protein